VKQAATPSDQPPLQSDKLNDADEAEIDRLLSAADATTGASAPPASADSHEMETSSAERSALQDVSAAVEVQTRADDNSVQSRTAMDTKLPLYLKPLQWINAPLMPFPAAVREAIGKIAILTLFNAIAVILYVLIFRRH
jgi:hypothetical protein